MRAFAALGVVAFLGGCSSPPLPGYLWSITVTGAQDLCNNPPVDYAGEKNFEYRIEFSGSSVTLSIEADAFATGAISGCDIAYDSVVWGEAHDGYDLKWQLHGEATFRQGGDSCNLDPGVDWTGTETFTIVSSDDAAVATGCTYTLDNSGIYEGPSQ